MRLRTPRLVLAGVALVGVAVAPGSAVGETAVINVLEAPARASPDDAAPVLHLFPGAQVSVSEAAEAGYRKVLLPGGASGWIAESALSFPSRLTAPTAAAPDLRSRLVVAHAGQLEAATKDDSLVFQKAERLSARRDFVGTMGILGGIGSAVLFLGGVSRMSADDDRSSTTFLVAGLGAAAGTLAIMSAVSPRRAEVMAVMAEWNARHPERPLALAPPRGGSR